MTTVLPDGTVPWPAWRACRAPSPEKNKQHTAQASHVWADVPENAESSPTASWAGVRCRARILVETWAAASPYVALPSRRTMASGKALVSRSAWLTRTAKPCMSVESEPP